MTAGVEDRFLEALTRLVERLENAVSRMEAAEAERRAKERVRSRARRNKSQGDQSGFFDDRPGVVTLHVLPTAVAEEPTMVATAVAENDHGRDRGRAVSVSPPAGTLTALTDPIGSDPDPDPIPPPLRTQGIDIPDEVVAELELDAPGINIREEVSKALIHCAGKGVWPRDFVDWFRCEWLRRCRPVRERAPPQLRPSSKGDRVTQLAELARREMQAYLEKQKHDAARDHEAGGRSVGRVPETADERGDAGEVEEVRPPASPELRSG